MRKNARTYAKAIIFVVLDRLNLKARYGDGIGTAMFNASICTTLHLAALDIRVNDDEFTELMDLAGDSENREFWRRGLEYIL